MKLKITIVKKFSPEEVFGHKVKRTSGELVPLCGLEEREYIVEHQFKMPQDFCGKAWQDISRELSILWYGVDYDYTEPYTIYATCTDGIRPVVFKIQPLDDPKIAKEAEDSKE
ncbi:MAG: TIGR04076 family protein [Candidatus Thorarchaeota archaeon]